MFCTPTGSLPLNFLLISASITSAILCMVRTACSGAEHFCWRIEIQPRLTALAGLELGTGVNVCIVAPEQAAAELREL